MTKALHDVLKEAEKLPEAERKKELDKMQSYFRKNINTEMAQKCFERDGAFLTYLSNQLIIS